MKPCIQGSWQSLSVSVGFNHSCDAPPWVKLWKIRVASQWNLGEKLSLKAEGWILCCQPVADTMAQLCQKKTLGSLEPENLVTLEILHWHPPQPPCVWPWGTFLGVGGSLEQWEIVASWERHSWWKRLFLFYLELVWMRNILLRIDVCHFCVLSVEVLIEFLSSPILKKEDESGSSNGERQPRSMGSIGAFILELQKIWAKWNIFLLIKPLRMLYITAYFWQSGLMDLIILLLSVS